MILHKLSSLHEQEHQGESTWPFIGIISIASVIPSPAGGMPMHDAPRPVPFERWNIEDVQQTSPIALEARFGAFIEDANLFDGMAFSISRCFVQCLASQCVMFC